MKGAKQAPPSILGNEEASDSNEEASDGDGSAWELEDAINGHCEDCAAVISQYTLEALVAGAPVESTLQHAYAALSSDLKAADVPGQIEILFGPQARATAAPRSSVPPHVVESRQLLWWHLNGQPLALLEELELPREHTLAAGEGMVGEQVGAVARATQVGMWVACCICHSEQDIGVPTDPRGVALVKRIERIEVNTCGDLLCFLSCVMCIVNVFADKF